MEKNVGTGNFFCREFIGLKAKIIDSTDTGRKGISGMVVDETMQTFLIETKNGEKLVPKKEVKLLFVFGKQKVLVDGKKIVFRPEDRIKALLGKKNL